MNGSLIRRAQRGDADAFTELCAPYEAMVYRHCLQMLQNHADAQDAAQDAMLRAYRAMPRFRAQSGFATWLYRIAHNVCLDWLKRPNRGGLSLDSLAEGGYDPADPAPTPDGSYVAESERARLREAVTQLSDELQTLLSLRYGDGLSYEELAEATGLNVGTVRSRLSRAREKLRALLPETE